MKNITERFVNESREIEYRVAFIDTKDSEGLPFTVRILVERENQRVFENWLENERDNSIIHAEGGTVEY
jgi:hypothetical protein